MQSHTRIPTYHVLFSKYRHLQKNREVSIPSTTPLDIANSWLSYKLAIS